MARADITLTAVDQTRAAFDSVKRNLGDVERVAGSLSSTLAGLGAGLSAGALIGFVRSSIDAADNRNSPRTFGGSFSSPPSHAALLAASSVDAGRLASTMSTAMRPNTPYACSTIRLSSTWPSARSACAHARRRRSRSRPADDRIPTARSSRICGSSSTLSSRCSSSSQ